MAASLIATVTVSRKTPQDGKLEVPQAVADRLTSSGAVLSVSAPSGRASASVEAMACTCAKAAGAGHVHHFLVSDVLRSLEPESEVTVGLEPGGTVVVAPLA